MSVPTPSAGTRSHSAYDANGNIPSDGTTTYAYDSPEPARAGYNTAAGKAWEYTPTTSARDILSTEYDYADGQTSNPVTVSYTYGDAMARDLLLPTTAKR